MYHIYDAGNMKEYWFVENGIVTHYYLHPKGSRLQLVDDAQYNLSAIATAYVYLGPVTNLYQRVHNLKLMGGAK